MTKSKKTGNVTYLFKMKDGSAQKATMPASWKLTYGMIAPGKPGSSYNNSDKMCVRAYDGTLLQAVFTEVESFRNMDIEVMEQIVETKQETIVKETPEGNKAFLVEAKSRSWRNPDLEYTAPKEFTSLPKLVQTEVM